jgi:hypothetical protein
MTRVQAIKTFFESNGGRKIENREILNLSAPERTEIGQMCADAMGVQIDAEAGEPAKTLAPVAA